MYWVILLKGDLAALSSAIEGLAINVISSFERSIRKVVQGVTDLISVFNEFLATEQDIKSLDEAHQDFTLSIEVERNKVNDLFQALNDANTSSEDRKKIIDEINDQYGDYLPNLISEKTTTEELVKAQQALVQSFLSELVVKEEQENIQAALNTQAKQAKNLAVEKLKIDKEVAKLVRENQEIEAKNDQIAQGRREFNIEESKFDSEKLIFNKQRISDLKEEADLLKEGRDATLRGHEIEAIKTRTNELLTALGLERVDLNTDVIIDEDKLSNQLNKASNDANNKLIEQIKKLNIDLIEQERLRQVERLKLQFEADEKSIETSKGSQELKNEAIFKLNLKLQKDINKVNDDFAIKSSEARLKAFQEFSAEFFKSNDELNEEVAEAEQKRFEESRDNFLKEQDDKKKQYQLELQNKKDLSNAQFNLQKASLDFLSKQIKDENTLKVLQLAKVALLIREQLVKRKIANEEARLKGEKPNSSVNRLNDAASILGIFSGSFEKGGAIPYSNGNQFIEVNEKGQEFVVNHDATKNHLTY